MRHSSFRHSKLLYNYNDIMWCYCLLEKSLDQLNAAIANVEANVESIQALQAKLLGDPLLSFQTLTFIVALKNVRAKRDTPVYIASILLQIP